MECGPELMKRYAGKIPVYYTNNPDAMHELPCLQTGRRGGKAYFQIGCGHDHFRHQRYFRRHPATLEGS